MTTDYEDKVEDFNKAANASYICRVKFLKIRKTSKGLKVGFTCGKPHEIAQLRMDVKAAGRPYYCNF